VGVPDELSLELDQLHVLAVELADDLGIPFGVKRRQLLGKVDRIHFDLQSFDPARYLDASRVLSRPAQNQVCDAGEVEGPEDNLVVPGEPLREEDVEIRSPVFGVAGRHRREGAAPAVEEEDEDLDEHDAGEPCRGDVLTAPRQHRDGHNAQDEEHPHDRVDDLHCEQGSWIRARNHRSLGTSANEPKAISSQSALSRRILSFSRSNIP